MAEPFGDDLRHAPMSELVNRLASDLSVLVRQEFELLRSEMTDQLSQSGRRAGQGAGMLSAAAVCGLMALGTLTATAILLLALAFPPWLAALIVTIGYGVGAGVAAIEGKRKLQELTPPVPRQTIETVKEDVEWAKSQTTSAKR